MTRKESDKLKMGDKIFTDTLPVGEHHVGEITQKNWMMVLVKWDDGQVGEIHLDDMQEFSKV